MIIIITPYSGGPEFICLYFVNKFSKLKTSFLNINLVNVYLSFLFWQFGVVVVVVVGAKRTRNQNPRD